jgi:AcrR family transcriptional regulator
MPVDKPPFAVLAAPVRREQAARTRQRILDAAADLFAPQGYGTTSVRQIAESARVAPDTVCATFGSSPQPTPAPTRA